MRQLLFLLILAMGALACSDDGHPAAPPTTDPLADAGDLADTAPDTPQDVPTLDTDANPDAPPVVLHCTTETCPELAIAGDPVDRDCLGLSPCFARGMVDPSLEHDPATGTVWLAYTAGTAVLADPADPTSVSAAHRTHLARSDDHGQTWTFVAELNPATPRTHPTTGRLGTVENEIPTLAAEPDGTFSLLWLQYFETPGASPQRSDFLYARKAAPSPTALADAPISERLRGTLPSQLGAAVVLSEIAPELADCLAFTEPGAYTHAGDSWLVTLCLAVNDAHNGVDYARSRNVLLQRVGDTYRYVGVLLDSDDARAFGGDTLEQAALADSRTPGRTLLIVTPVDHTATVPHQGCVVFELQDLAAATVARGDDGRLRPLATITADGGQLGPGLCDYDPASDTGVLLTIPVADPTKNPPDLRIAVHTTGVHP